ncbi:perilipin-2-like isoform X2 [Takifugu rubripes]|uniref:perilipin-2-like isoform X2 n=1 Tax=Takifugu rubripes TaxID=31033 RepID=UPI001145E84F|nr:perilipin-2-like isoform X2 [Takifugu rubripes]
MPIGNSNQLQRRPNAADRLAALPLVASARTKLSVVYSGTKCSHPRLRCVCEGLERCVTVVLSPVVDKLQPHVSIANEVACKGLDWLEAVFPMLLATTEQVVATAKDKVAEIQDAASVAANGSADCVNMGVAWLMVRLEVAQDRAGQPLVDRAIAAAAAGVDSALAMSEALVDRMLPPTEEIKTAQGFEVTTLTSVPERLLALAAKLYKRMLGFEKSQFALIWTIQEMPQYLHHQLVSAIIFISQMENYPPSRCQRSRKPSRPCGPDIAYMDSIQMLPDTTPPTGGLRTKSEECSVKGCVDR